MNACNIVQGGLAYIDVEIAYLAVEIGLNSN
jgi:hypothetical protein